MSETNSDSENSGSTEIQKYYKPGYIMKDTGRVYIYDDSKLTTFEFVDYVDYNVFIVSKIEKNLEYISQKSRQISSSNSNYKRLVQEKKSIIYQNFQQFMSQVALLFSQSEYFDLSNNQ
ncbi:Hypothetical_protein [Hexamita inflata]|uniref:Hypothetical_protein n=1 Tax=Hexamita inflata TaxID=28002 RepID=A0AA86TB71_9EUKA|nr:Hypothetical protein HINF_LOCUS945 [Hexamita inflata]